MSLNEVFVYHYSDQKYPVLKTLAGVKPISAKERNHYTWLKVLNDRVGADHERLSFLIDPIPRSTIVDIFHGRHLFWAPEKRIYEYKVSLRQISDRLGWFEIRSTVEEQRLKEEYNGKLSYSYSRKRRALLEEHNYLSRFPITLYEAISRMKNTLEPSLQLIQVDQLTSEDLVHRAPRSPHLVVFPKFPSIHYEHVESFVLPPHERTKPLSSSS